MYCTNAIGTTVICFIFVVKKFRLVTSRRKLYTRILCYNEKFSQRIFGRTKVLWYELIEFACTRPAACRLQLFPCPHGRREVFGGPGQHEIVGPLACWWFVGVAYAMLRGSQWRVEDVGDRGFARGDFY